MKKVFVVLFMLGSAVTPAMADYIIRDGNGAQQTVKSRTPGGAILPMQQINDVNGNAVLDPQPSVRSSAAEASHVLKSSAGTLYKVTVVVPDTGYIMIFDAVADPADGAVTPAWCEDVAGSKTINFSPGLSLTNGIVVAYSTTGCFTKTESATASFFGQVQ